MSRIFSLWEAARPVSRMGAVILGVLVLASLCSAILKRARPDRDIRELAARVRSWWIMASVFFCAIFLEPRLSLAFFAFMSFWALKEYVTLLKTRPADHRTLVWAFLTIPIQYWWIHAGWYGMFIIFIPVYMFLFLPVRLILSRETAGFVASMSTIHWGLMTFVFGLSHLAALLTLPLKTSGPADGRSLVLFVVFTTEMSDVLQYVWGKLLGKRKILPTVSPNKTWEGLLGGLASLVLLSPLLRFLTPFTVPEMLAVSAGIVLAGFLGGAVMSAVKRDIGVKDYGTLIPGHGGMIDRVDSLCYAVPLFFHYVRYFHAL